MRELILRKCNNCGALVKVISDCKCTCGINCCDKEMKIVKANSEEASFEKHIPSYEIRNDKIIVNVNHVMEEEHFINWIMFVGENSEEIIYFNPMEDAKAEFKKQKGILYAYCNKHGLWSCEVTY